MSFLKFFLLIKILCNCLAYECISKNKRKASVDSPASECNELTFDVGNYVFRGCAKGCFRNDHHYNYCVKDRTMSCEIKYECGIGGDGVCLPFCCVPCTGISVDCHREEMCMSAATGRNCKASTCGVNARDQEKDRTLLERKIIGFENYTAEGGVYDEEYDAVFKEVCKNVYGCLYNKKKHLCAGISFATVICLACFCSLAFVMVVVFLVVFVGPTLIDVCNSCIPEKKRKAQVYKKIKVPSKYQVMNGMTGLNRDIVLRLCGLLRRNTKKIRTVVGMSQEHAFWKQRISAHVMPARRN